MELEEQLKQLIIDTLNLEGMITADIPTGEALFGEGVGLDSIDALELGLAIKNTFGVQLSSENEEMRGHFYSVKTLADYIRSQKGE